MLNRATDREEGLILEKNGKSKTNLLCSKNYGQKKCLETKRFKHLKPRQKKKPSCRIGIRAEALKQTLSTTIEDIAGQQHQTAKKKCCADIGTEIALLAVSDKSKI